MDETGNLYFKSGKPFHGIEKEKIEEINYKIAYLHARQEKEVRDCALLGGCISSGMYEEDRIASIDEFQVFRLATIALATDILKELDKIIEGGLTLQQATAILESFHMTLEINYRQMADIEIEIKK